jgi:hypothetical protein
MKFRASYGRLGNSNVGNYYHATMGKSTTDWIGPDGAFVEYIYAPGFGNYFLTWEKPTTFNLAVDMGFFSNRIQTTFDWYQRKTTDMIGPSEPVPAIIGESVPIMNNTELKGKGWEFTFSYMGNIGDFRFNTGLNIGRYRDEVTKYYNPEGFIGFTPRGRPSPIIYYNGMALGEIWGFETVGFINDEETLANLPDQTLLSANWGLGDIHYKDQNGDGKINWGQNTLDDHGDIIIIGNETPDFNYNITFSGNYKGADLRLFINGLGPTDWWPRTGQGDRAGNTDWVFFGSSNNWYNHSNLADHLDYWTPENKNAYYPRALVSGSAAISERNRKVQTKYLQNRAYLRFKNIQVGYSFPSKLTERLFISNARIYISGENLITFTRLRIFDPETPGLIYPLQKSVSTGINLTF